MLFRTKFCLVTALFAACPLVSAADFPSSCFVETSEFVPKQPGNVTVSTDWRDDLFFLQNGTVLPAAPKSVSGNSAIAAKLVDAPSWKGADFSNVQDASEETYVEIPPSVRAEETVRLTFDFGKTLPRETFRLVSSVVWGRYSVEASTDGKTFFETDERSVARFDLRFVRLTFPPAPEQSAITVIRSFRFLSVSKGTVFVRAEGTSPITAFRTYRCDLQSLSSFVAERDGKFSDVAKLKPSDNPVVPVFKGNPGFAQDADSDGISDALDNCPNVANPSQSDRNFDGRGDACSDDDSDGRRGSEDNCPTVSNPKQTDANRNGVGDECEFDTDKDGVPDGIDNAIHASNSDQSDKDGDRIGDVIDNCELPNADQLDLDKNGKGDVCDRDFEYRNANDTDKDGVLDSQDNCEKIPNANQKDSDSDNVGDACDNCPAIVNEDQLDLDKNGKGDACEDSDNDGIEGWRDNCVSISNADQKDSNNDRIGDVCSDTDGDKVYDGSDVCPAAYDPDQEDVDSDGKWNACDAKDDRALESNRTVFAVLAVIVALAFLSGIGWVLVTMSKNAKSE